MEAASREELTDASRLVELTSDAVAICGLDGTIGHVNQRLCELMGRERREIVGADIKDLLFSAAFERALDHELPFPLDGSASSLMLKLSDGSFVPVEARAISLTSHRDELLRGILKRLHARGRVLVVIRSLEEQYAHDRQMRRVLSELQAANKRLSGTLSVIMATVGAKDLPELLNSVLNKLVDALDAGGSTIYFSENGGFKLRGVSESLLHDYVPEFIPLGAGVPTYVLREARPCRLSVTMPGEDVAAASGRFYDMDRRRSRPVRAHEMPPFKTLIAVPVFFGTQVLGVIEVGWKRPTMPRRFDVNVIEVVCDYLSIELVSLVSALRSRRAAELNRSLNHMRDTIYAFGDDRNTAWAELTQEVRRVLRCHVCPVAYDRELGCYVVDFEGGSQVPLPGDVERLFFSATAPAARLNPAMEDFFAQQSDIGKLEENSLRFIRLTRVDQLSRAGEWLLAHGLPNQGVYFDLSSGEGEEATASASDAAIVPAGPAAAGPPQKFLLLRDSTQEPIDDIEYDYLVRLAHDFELVTRTAQRSTEDRRIAQTLQIGMRSSLEQVPGITSDALYSSATRQALVGGDFYTLMRLPDDQAVMILGDVSGKGIEAASMSALVKTALTAYAWEGASPVHMVRSLNSMLMSFSRVETFATMFVAKIDLKSGEAAYCSAGHPPSLLVHHASVADGGEHAGYEIESLSTQSGVVGAFESMRFEGGSFRFAAGDVLFMYTDGAIEARSRDGEFFGERRLRDLLLNTAGMDVHGLCQRVLGELDDFTESSLEDDIALVALRFDIPRAGDHRA